MNFIQAIKNTIERIRAHLAYRKRMKRAKKNDPFIY